MDEWSHQAEMKKMTEAKVVGCHEEPRCEERLVRGGIRYRDNWRRQILWHFVFKIKIKILIISIEMGRFRGLPMTLNVLFFFRYARQLWYALGPIVIFCSCM